MGGPIGIALAGIAGGAAVLFGKIARDAENAASTVRLVFENAAADAISALNETVRGSAFVEFLSQLGGGDAAKGVQKLTEKAAAAGVSFQTVRDAYIAGGAELEALLTLLDGVGTKTDSAGQLSRFHKNEVADTRIKAQGLADDLRTQNTLIGVGLQQQAALNSLYGDDHVAQAISDRTADLKTQKDDLNSSAAAQERFNTAATDPRIVAAIDERTRALGRQRTAAEQVAAVTPTGRAGTVVGGRTLRP